MKETYKQKQARLKRLRAEVNARVISQNRLISKKSSANMVPSPPPRSEGKASLHTIEGGKNEEANATTPKHDPANDGDRTGLFLPEPS